MSSKAAEQSVSGLKTTEGIDLRVLLVADSGGQALNQFARAVWDANRLGQGQILLVITTGTPASTFWTQGSTGDVTTAELQQIQRQILAPLVQSGAYEQAILQAVRALAGANSTPADPGSELPQLIGRVTDTTGLLNGGHDEVERAISALKKAEGIEMFVLFVETTGNMDLTEYGPAVAHANGLTPQDALFIADVPEHTETFLSYSTAMWLGGGVPGVTETEVNDLLQGPVAEQFSAFDFVQAPIAAAEALGKALHAEEIPGITGSVTDTADVLGTVPANLTAAIDQLAHDSSIRFFAVFVPTTGNVTIDEFADSVQTKNRGPLSSAYALLVVSTDNNSADLRADDPTGKVTDDLQSGALAAARARLSSKDYSGAVLQAVTALHDGLAAASPEIPKTATSTPSNPTGPITVPNISVPDVGEAASEAGKWALAITGLILGSIVLFIVAVVVLAKVSNARRRGRAARAQAEQVAALGRDASDLLLKADDTVHNADQEIGFAEAELSSAEVQPLREAVQLAREELQAAFALRQKLDDSEPEDDSTRAEMLREIAKRSQGALDVVGGELAKLQKLRDLERTAPDLLSKLPDQLTALEARYPAAEATLGRLGAFAGSNWEPVKTNLDEAKRRVSNARAQVDAGNKAVAAGDRRSVVRAALQAQALAGQATSLLDNLETTETSLLQVQAGLAGDMEKVRASLVEANQAAGAAGNPALAAAEASLQQAGELIAGDKPDVVSASRLTTDAGAVAARALQGLQQAAKEEARDKQVLARLLRDADLAIARARAIVDPRRDTAGEEARTRLHAAQQTLEVARQNADSDRSTAIAAARRAEGLADAAYNAASSDFTLQVQPLQLGATLSSTADLVRLAGAMIEAAAKGRQGAARR